MALNMADLFEHAVDAFPERVALICGDRRLTYSELEDEANRLAHHLAARGAGPGDHVGLYARNSVEAVATLLAVIKLRAVAININYRYLASELAYHLRDGDLSALVHDQDLAGIVDAVAAPGLPRVTIGANFDEAVAAASGARDFGPRSPDDIYIIYTGGTTGHPKGVMWRHEDIWRTLAGGIDFITGEPLEDEWAQSRKGSEGGAGSGLVRMAPAPLIHGAAMVATLACLFGGDTAVIMPKFDPDELWATVQRHRVNVLSVIGDAMARPLMEALAAGNYDTSSLVSLNSTAALFSPVVKDAVAKALPSVFLTEAIGSTETGFAGIALVSADAEHRGGPTVTAGPDVIVIGEAGRPCGPGETGKLARGGHIPLGYYKDPAKTAEMFTEVNGRRYAVPGDWARVEEGGTITLLGRGNTCVNTGGEKVFPEEVEGALKSHPDVFDALVLGVPDDRLGQRVAALIQLRPGASADAAALQAQVRGQLAGYKVPRTVWFVESVGRTVSGKADYAWARAYAEAHAPAPGTPAEATQ
ncbi:MAG TPA: acyl-CoA synthetase [Streptosporangiaceae bacterium]|nr:acyl-CoA synthetase [Streptosporangiaceae bacterium]